MAIAIFSAGAPASGNGLITEDQLNDLVLAERTFALAMADSADLFMSPAIYYTDASGSGSLVQRHRQLALGWSLSMDATAAEDTDVSASSVNAFDADVTVARRALRLDQTGLARAVGQAWGFDPISLGLTMVGSFQAGRMGMLGTAIAAASTNITSDGQGSVDDLYDCIDSFTAATGDPGQLTAMLHPFTMAAIRDSMRSESGFLQHRIDVQQFLAKGAEMLLGILCFPSTKVTNAAGYHENAVMAPGAIAYSAAMPLEQVGDNSGVIARPSDMPLKIAVQQDISRDVEEIVANGYDGLAIREQARIRGLRGATS